MTTARRQIALGAMSLSRWLGPASIALLSIGCTSYTTDDARKNLNAAPGISVHRYGDTACMVSFSGPTIERKHIERLASIGEVRQLRIASTNLTDEDLLCLPYLPRLSLLSITESSFDGRFLRDGTKFPNIENLTLQSDIFQETNLRLLVQFSNLKEIDLSDMPITDDGVILLSRLSQLEQIELANTGVDIHGVEAIAQLSHLESLGLEGTGLGESVVRALSRITTLRHLNLAGTRVTNEAVEQLKLQLPECCVNM